MYSPIKSFKIKDIASGEVNEMSCEDKLTCPAKVVLLIEFAAMTIVVAETADNSVDCVATLVCVVIVGRVKVFDLPPSG